MDNLRWVLLVLGIVIVAAVYLFSRYEVWGKLSGFKRQFQQKKTQGVDIAARREPVRFDETDEILADDGPHSGFAVSEFAGELPVFHAENEEPQVNAGDWLEETFDYPHEEPEEQPTEQLESDTLILPESLHEEEAKKNVFPVLDKPLETEVEPLNLDAPEEFREEELPADVDPLVLVLSVMANDEHWFQGAALKKALEAEGLDFGAMEIFHYYHADRKPEIFSAANVLEPGTFDLESLDNSSIPGITLFCQLPGALSATDGFDIMLACARNLAAQLHGKVCDDKRNTLTSQAINHYRDQIEAFNRQLVLARKA